MQILKWPSTLVCTFLMMGCIGNKNLCPEEVGSEPDANSSGLMWGSDKAKVSAQIVSVAAECIPIVKDKEKESDEDETIYRIPVTAFLSYEIHDKKWFKDVTEYQNLRATVIFEAKSKSGVVLKSSTGRIKIISNSTSGDVSGTLHLLPGELSKLQKITARWEYGRD